jgi:hypothetical protein
MDRLALETALAAAIDAESAVGIRWGPGSVMAPIAYRRWTTFARRHPRSKHPTAEDRIRDLATGLQERFEPGKLFTPFTEWLHLASVLAAVLQQETH